MLDKGYMKNFNKLKSKLNLDNSRPSFLEDDQSQLSSFVKPQYQAQKVVNKSSKVFDLDLIKKQLGLIESRNYKNEYTSIKSKPENTVFLGQPQITLSKSISKQQRPDSSNGISKLMQKRKQAQPLNIKFADNIHEERTGFTQRITELVKMRQQHEKIINSLVNKKASNVSTDEQTQVGFRKRNPQVQNKYIRVVESYQISKKQRPGDAKAMMPERLSFKKEAMGSRYYEQTDQPTKKRSVQQMYNEIQVKLNTPKKRQSPKQKSYKTQCQSVHNDSVHDIAQNEMSQSVLSSADKSFSKPQDTFLPEDSLFPESVQQSRRQVTQQSQMNESTFQIHQHVNLIASLSQFQFRASGNEGAKDVSLGSQLHYSIDFFVKQSVRKKRQNQDSQAFSCLNEVEIKYTCMESQYQSSPLLLKAVGKIKGLNRDFFKIVQFLCQNEAWQGLLLSELAEYGHDQDEQEKSPAKTTLMQYRGLHFDCGSYSQVLLSDRPLEEIQKTLLIFKQVNGSQTLICDISLVLLYRLINLTINKSFPEMLNKLFGYQFKAFNINHLNDFMQCLDYIDRLREIHNKQLKNQGGLIVDDKLNQTLKDKYSLKHIEYHQQTVSQQTQETTAYLLDSQKHCDFLLYGQNKTTECYELIRPAFLSEKNKTQSPIRLYEFRELMRHQKYMKRLSDVYKKLAIINKKELPVKSIRLKHFENHFVVVSVNVVEQGLYFMSVGPQQNKNDHFDQVSYRMCLISSSTKTILECLILAKNESYPVYLPKQQFEVYISAYRPHILLNLQPEFRKNEKNTEIMNFTFYMQSQHISSKSNFFNADIGIADSKQLEFQLRLKEEYKNYTSMVLQQFIEFSFLDKEISQFFIQNDNNHLDSQNIQQENQSISLNQPPAQCSENKQIGMNADPDFEFSSTLNFLKFPSSQKIVPKQKIAKQEDQRFGPTTKSFSTPNEQFFTFQQMGFQTKSLQVTILRVHLKALDLFIDCINTGNLKELTTSSNNDFQFKVKYSQERVLCDLNHHKNTVLLRSNKINLVYLTKDSPIEQIIKQNEFCQKRDTNQPIAHQIFRKQW